MIPARTRMKSRRVGRAHRRLNILRIGGHGPPYLVIGSPIAISSDRIPIILRIVVRAPRTERNTHASSATL